MLNGVKIEKWLKRLIFAGLLALVVLIFSQKIEFTASDLGRHLENGKIVWQNSQVLFKNFYSYTEPDTRFINHHWLGGVIYYAVYLIGGFNLLSFLNILLILAAFILAFKLAEKKAGFYISALISIPVIFLLSERVEVRPEIFSYLFIVLTWFILERASERKNYRLLLWLIPLFIFWANIHIYFFIGLALVGFKMVSEFLPLFISTTGSFKIRFSAAWPLARVWAKNLGLLALACLLNPNFILGLFYPFNIFKNYGYEIAENKSIFYLGHLMINYNFPLFKTLLLLWILTAVAYFFFFKKIPWFNLFVGLFFSVLALFASRNLAIFSLAALILISANLAAPFSFLKNNISYLNQEIREKYRPYLAGFIFLLIIIGIIYLLFDTNRTNNFIKNPLGWGLSQGSEDSIKFFKDNKLNGPIFNNYDLGSALIFWIYPQESVFVDNRPEAYSNEFWNNIYRPMQMERAKWLEISAKYNFKTIYFSYTDSTPWAQTFLSTTLDDNWALAYFDRYTTIFLNKKEYDAATLNKLTLGSSVIRERLRSLAADSSLKGKFQLASLAQLIHQPDLAEEIYREIIFSNPDNGLALGSLGVNYASSQNRADLLKALSHLQAGLEAGYKLPSIYNQIGLVNWQLGDYQKAEAAWRSALKLDRSNTSAVYYLEQIRQLRLQGVLK